jgi:hypothetical protein
MKNHCNFLFVLLVISLYSKIVFSQSWNYSDPCDPVTNSMWNFYSENLLSTVFAGKGYTGIASVGDVSSSILNPASVSIEKKLQLYIGITQKTNIAVDESIKDYHIENGFPSGIIGGIFRLKKNMEIGFLYYNSDSYKEVYNNVYVTGKDNMKKFYNEISNQMVIHSFSIPIIFQKSIYRIGVSLGAYYFRADAKNFFKTWYTDTAKFYDNAHSNLWRFLPKLGLIVSPTEYFSFGAVYSPGFTDDTDWYLTDSSENPLKSTVGYPDTYGIGIEFKLLRNRLIFSLDYQHSNNSMYSYLKDRNNIHFGLEYLVNESLNLRGGYFTLYDFRNRNSTLVTWPDAIDAYQQFFITFGGTYKYKFCSINIAVMDSHLILNSDVSHTKLNGSLCFNF